MPPEGNGKPALNWIHRNRERIRQLFVTAKIRYAIGFVVELLVEALDVCFLMDRE
jgi:hypothetical protein